MTSESKLCLTNDHIIGRLLKERWDLTGSKGWWARSSWLETRTRPDGVNPKRYRVGADLRLPPSRALIKFQRKAIKKYVRLYCNKWHRNIKVHVSLCINLDFIAPLKREDLSEMENAKKHQEMHLRFQDFFLYQKKLVIAERNLAAAT